VACDVMYARDQITNLIASLEHLLKEGTIALICHGRNAHAEEAFLDRCEGRFIVTEIDWNAFDPEYRSDDISCLRLTKSNSQPEGV